MTSLALTFLTTIFVNNLVLTRFLGLCPFLGTSKNSSSSIGMGLTVIFVITFSSFITHIVNYLILVPYNLQYLQTLVFILIIASMVQIIEILLKKFFRSLYQALGIFLPLVTTNCAVLGVVLINTGNHSSLLNSTLYGFSAACGFALALLTLNSIRENLHEKSIPESFKGNAILFISIGILALGYMGFQLMDK
ncbi:MAG: electron transport complex subunit RsxA [Proteobacteria bacterium]|nr:electron transport complex subunit RsxA [Pseudomonadota bacterium]